jgi:choline dehydrogenase
MTPRSPDDEVFDYIVVGAGTAGCVLASRLAEDPAARVLLVEAGPRGRHWSVAMPSAFGENFERTRFNWALTTVPQATLNGREVYQPAGRVLGGSSAINGMVFLRGHPLDFNRWADVEGAAGWSWGDVLPYFKRLESYGGPASEYRGSEGPIRIRPGSPRGPMDRAFLEAGTEAGYPTTGDVNGFQQDGFGAWDANIRDGRRDSAATGYLSLKRANLVIRSGAVVSRVLLSAGAATGVEYLAGRRRCQARATREVILTAGALQTPRLLMLSGIGPQQDLRRLGIDVAQHSPGVGQNLQDHIYIMVQYTTRGQKTLNQYRTGLSRVSVGARWFLSHDGVAATNHIESGAFIRLSDRTPHPDGQIHFKPVLLDGWSLSREHGFNFGLSTMRPESRGTVGLADADPRSAPVIDPRYLTTARDMADAVALVRMTRELAHMAAFEPFRGRAVSLSDDATSDAEIQRFVREVTGSGYHPCGTCRMGTDERAVCSPDLRVNGIQRLRVADASVFPSVVSANTNATAFMVAERAGDLIRGQQLAAEALPFYGAGPRELSAVRR